jgi:tetraacyldisaccharide 4'-kinase
MAPAALADRRVLAFCGIGNPASFQAGLESLGAEIIDLMVFPDHHHYSAAEVAELIAWAQRVRADYLVTTQKDFVKVVEFIGSGQEDRPPLFFLRIRAVVTAGQRDFDAALGSAHPRTAKIAGVQTSIVAESP